MDLLETGKTALSGTLGAIRNMVNPTPEADLPVEITDGEKFYKESLEQQKFYHPVWFRNISAFLGHHWLDWNQSTNWFEATATPSWRVRLTVNLIMPTVRAAIAQELANIPQFHGMPSNSSQEAKDSARIASKIFEAKHHEDDQVNLMYRLRLWARMCGSSYLFVYKDMSAGKKWTDPVLGPDGLAAMNPDGTPQVKEYATGDVTFDVAPSFEVFLERGAPENFTEHTRIMRVKLMNVREIKDRYGVDVEPEKMSQEIMYQARIMSLVDTHRYRVSSEAQRLKNMALVKDYYELPTKDTPEGRHWIYANGKVLVPIEPIDSMYNGKKALPVAVNYDIYVPGRAYGMSMIEQIFPLNTQFNKMTSQVVENCNLMSRPKVLSPKGSLDDEAWTDQPGEVVEYIPGPNGQKPEPYKPAEMPSYFFEQKNEIPRLIEEVSGVHEVSKGRLPRRANSGIAIQSLQAADSGPISLSTRSWSSALTRVYSIGLYYMQKLYSEERMVRMIGKNHEVEVINFKGADLAGCDMVRVDFGPLFSRGEKIDVAMQLAEKGLITGQKALEMMEMGSMDLIFDEKQDDSNMSRVENMEIAKGIAHPVAVWENHEVHIKEHEAFLNSPNSAKILPENKQLLMEHMMNHKMLLSQGSMPGMGPAPMPGPQSAPPAPTVGGMA